MEFNFFEKLKSNKKGFNDFRSQSITSNLSAIKGGSKINLDESQLYCKQPCGAQFRHTDGNA